MVDNLKAEVERILNFRESPEDDPFNQFMKDEAPSTKKQDEKDALKSAKMFDCMQIASSLFNLLS